MIKSLFKDKTVFCIAFVAAVISCFFVHPDKQYLTYIDYKTICCLFATLAVVCALKDIMFFTILSRKIVQTVGNLRFLAIVLVIITFVGSMLIANDMALITFLPLGYLALSVTGKEKYSAYIFILQNISANLGGMVTPFGNPQNLYLYSYFNIPTGEFTLIMLPPFILAVTMLILCCLPFKCEKLTINEEIKKPLDIKRTVLYLLLFTLSILAVFRVVNFIVATVVVTVILLFVDRLALKSVDYFLILTFVCFFIFAGNMSRVDAVEDFVSLILNKNPLLVSLGSCQVISNVPTAILLSRFTDNYKALLLGVNIGGTGTLIASLASLITYSEYKTLYPEKSKSYLGLFALMNILFLAVLTVFSYLFLI
ncbi:MAG: citrate transporter [Clostridia bacterium]|nr:citrate transporter [Clostridia bacterium]